MNAVRSIASRSSASSPRPAALGTLLDARDLHIESQSDGGRHTIVSKLDLALDSGETIGIVGESGSGKSLSARALMRLLPPGVVASGSAKFRERHDLLGMSEREVARLRGSEIAIVFQDPFTMLNPLHRCGAHIAEALKNPDGDRLTGDERSDEVRRRLAEVGLRDERVAEKFPFQLSGGMRQRVGLAAALAQDPALLIADEPSTALDVTTQREILALLKTLQERRGMGLILVTHDLRVAFSVCDRVYVLYAGSLLEVGSAAELEREPLHPYTMGLLLAEPSVEHRARSLLAIPGSVPAPDSVAGGCTFAPRCGWAQAECVAESPPLRTVAPGHESACIRLGAIRAELAGTRRKAEPAEHRWDTGAQEPIVEVAELVKVFEPRSRRTGRAPVQALCDVSLEIGRHEGVGLVGESGSGKTTLGRCLVGLEEPTGGTITIDGVNATSWGELDSATRKRLRHTIQIVLQDPYSSLNPVHSIRAILTEALALAPAGAPPDATDVAELLQRVGLPAEYGQRKPVALSGGERQRVAIARALAVRPSLIICDEPVSALDVSVQAQILNLLQGLRDDLGVAYLFITHDLAVVRQVTDRLYVLHEGRVVEHGATDQVLNTPQHAYTRHLVESVPRPSPEWLRGVESSR